TVETRVITTLCTIDTLSLQVTSADVPYNMLLRFDGKQFPVWPEPIDTIPDSIPEFLLWPNPTNGEFTIQVNEDWGPLTRIEIYNMSGQRLMQQGLDGMRMTISLDLVSSQMLVVRLLDFQSGRKLSRRLILQH
nr:T9SS type A sorting domain-containing protein [Bacteroidia bacterium]